jgi:hypothetical protein
MLRRLFAFMTVFLLAANLFAGDPWKDKPYKQWDDKDIRKILFESPWAKQVTVNANWKSGGRGARQEGAATESGAGYGERRAGSEEGGAPMPGGSEQETAVPQATFTIRWASSLTMRRAIARSYVLHGTPEAQAEQGLTQEPPEYVVAIVGQDMAPFLKADEAGLKGKSYLMMKKTKAKLEPVRVEIRRDAQRISSIVFYFVKNSSTGEPSIAADERQVEFGCEVRGLSIKAKFEPQKMTAEQGMDL